MLGSSLRHSVASTPPSAIGISTDSPVRLSVMVMLSGTAARSFVGSREPPANLLAAGPNAASGEVSVSRSCCVAAGRSGLCLPLLLLRGGPLGPVSPALAASRRAARATEAPPVGAASVRQRDVHPLLVGGGHEVADGGPHGAGRGRQPAAPQRGEAHGPGRQALDPDAPAGGLVPAGGGGGGHDRGPQALVRQPREPPDALDLRLGGDGEAAAGGLLVELVPERGAPRLQQ